MGESYLGWCRPTLRVDFLSSIGTSHVEYLKSFNTDVQSSHLLTKTPSVTNIANSKLFFPKAKNIILVRNPLDVAASSYGTWGTPVDVILKQWEHGVSENI